MSSYYREQGYGGRKQILRRLRYVWLLVVLCLLVGAFLVGYDLYKQAKNDSPSKESNAETSVIVANTQLISTPYFQFQSPKKWKAIANESRSNHFVYRQYNGPLIEQELVVDINRDAVEVLALVQTSRVLPVTVNTIGKLTPQGSISPHCREVIKPAVSNNPIATAYKNAKFSCNPQASSYIAVVSLVGGSDNMSLPRPSGTKAVYNITYKNLTAQATVGDFDNIVETFETR